MLSWPSETPYDLRFRLLNIPVRVHVMFWVITAILGGIGQASVESVAIWVACIFVSILVHELGHGLTARYYGSPAEIVLYWMGGLCRSEVDPRWHPWRRFAVVFMGPGASFLLGGLTLAVLYFGYRVTLLDVVAFFWEIGPSDPFALLVKLRGCDPRLARVLLDLVQFNVFWAGLNLLPVWPLDGGQLAGILLGRINPARGRQWTHGISLLTAGVLAFVAYQFAQNLFLAIFFAMFAMSNFQILQMMHQQRQFSGYDDSDEDWYRR